jgi:hypothetical protein
MGGKKAVSARRVWLFVGIIVARKRSTICFAPEHSESVQVPKVMQTDVRGFPFLREAGSLNGEPM